MNIDMCIYFYIFCIYSVYLYMYIEIQFRHPASQPASRHPASQPASQPAQPARQPAQPPALPASPPRPPTCLPSYGGGNGFLLCVWTFLRGVRAHSGPED